MNQMYYWMGIKAVTVVYVAKRLECQQIKVEHQHPIGKLNPSSILDWKWK